MTMIDWVLNPKHRSSFLDFCGLSAFWGSPNDPNTGLYFLTLFEYKVWSFGGEEGNDLPTG